MKESSRWRVFTLMQWLKIACKNRFFALVPLIDTMILLPSHTIVAVILRSFESLLLSSNEMLLIPWLLSSLRLTLIVKSISTMLTEGLVKHSLALMLSCSSCRSSRLMTSARMRSQSVSSRVVFLTRAVKQSIGFTEKAPTRTFSWLKAPTSAFTYETLLC